MPEISKINLRSNTDGRRKLRPSFTLETKIKKEA